MLIAAIAIIGIYFMHPVFVPLLLALLLSILLSPIGVKAFFEFSNFIFHSWGNFGVNGTLS